MWILVYCRHVVNKYICHKYEEYRCQQLVLDVHQSVARRWESYLLQGTQANRWAELLRGTIAYILVLPCLLGWCVGELELRVGERASGIRVGGAPRVASIRGARVLPVFSCRSNTGRQGSMQGGPRSRKISSSIPLISAPRRSAEQRDAPGRRLKSGRYRGGPGRVLGSHAKLDPRSLSASDCFQLPEIHNNHPREIPHYIHWYKGDWIRYKYPCLS